MTDKKVLIAIKQLQSRVSDLEQRIDRFDHLKSNKTFDKPTDYELNQKETKEESEKREFTNLIRQTGLEKAPKEEKIKLYRIYMDSGPNNPKFSSLLMSLRSKYDEFAFKGN